MTLIENLVFGFSIVVEPTNLFFCFAGVFLGTLVGVLPGVGPTATIAMLIPITFAMTPTAAVIMLAGIYYGSQYGGSTTAILLNVPGESSNAITAMDGYKMALQGRAGAALAIAALGSFFAGTVCTLAIALFAVPLGSIALKFNSADYFSLMLVGLIGAVALAHGSILKSLAMIMVGLLFGLVGTDIYTAVPRFTLGFVELADGINFVPIAIGLFGLPEILRNLEKADSAANAGIARSVGRLWPIKDEFRASTPATLRGTLLGGILGILPGAGATIASFMAYTLEKRVSRHPERFGNGAPEGVAAPESANNAAAQTAFIPMLALGIPSTPNMAVIIGALLVQGFAPGPTVITAHPDFFWAVIVSMRIGNAFLLILNLPLVGLWVQLLRIPYSILFPAVLIFCAVGTYAVDSNIFDVYALVASALIGYVLGKCNCEPAPLVLGFVLGAMIDKHFRRALLVSDGDPAIFIERPISAGLLAVAVLLLVITVVPGLRRQRDRMVEE
ncbi:MAG: tripartite tricarboxylate transporter permease [Alphaproteobacteria bacterium]|nr:tripartite tricarboxylate transporter permease [Alphaproteobacteria bacterium]